MSSPSKICMNGLCGATATPQWKRGWPMKAGGFAILCYSCGTAYDNVNYCERFHLNEPGWRECKFCDKPIHCGCVVSRYLHECLDLGGISCTKCLKTMRTPPLKQSYVNDIPSGFASFSGNWRPSVTNNQTNGDATLDKGKLTPSNKALEKHQHSPLTPSISQQFRQDKTRLSSGEFGMGFSSSKDFSTIFPNNPPLMATPINNRASLGQRSLGLALGNAMAVGTSSSSATPLPNGVMEEKVQEKVPSFKQGQRSNHIFPKSSKSRLNISSQFPKSSKSGVNIHSQSNKGMSIENRVARRPAEGRGRNQLLPRYWPKITDQELLQISGDLNSNCTIVPLFEKVLSASDAGRIGRLVLPKACAEAYFPPINQSEGLPIQIQDIKGKEWTFQFRFWPNNNSRMYVLEGVTPCIQNMQLQAGDIVIFSRLDPGEKLVIGCRKAEISADTQEAETSALPNGVNGGTSVGNETPAMKNGEQEEMASWDPVQRAEKKKSRNIGSKSKRLLMNSEDAMELKVTWEESQEFLRPAPTSEPTVVIIDNCEFEEFDEPPVFAKKTIFTMPANGLQEQWVECDSCSKRRKLPLDVLLPPKWTCSDNVWDPNRSSCSAPEEIRARDLERILKFGRESKKRKLEERKVIEEEAEDEEEEEEPSGLDALATAAVLGETTGELGESSAGPTTRHPRHRPGCSCIVCIQPPSGKGKHKPNCICNVCSTVKRRFKTLMLRKKKQQREKEESPIPISVDGISENRNGIEGQQLDLNCDPIKEEDVPLEWQNVLAGLVHLPPPKGTSHDGKDESAEMEVEKDTMAVEGS